MTRTRPSARSTPIAVMVCNGLASQPVVAAWTVFLQTSALGPFLGSLCSLVTNRESDPHSARAGLGRILGAGSIGA
jgi:hypothetical protein